MRHALEGTRILIVDDEEILAWSSVNRGAELAFLSQKVSQLTGHEVVREPLQVIGNSVAMKRVRGQLE